MNIIKLTPPHAKSPRPFCKSFGQASRALRRVCSRALPSAAAAAVAIIGASLALLPTPAAASQDSGPLIELLVRKGILSAQEAEEVRAELLREAAEPPIPATAASSLTTRLRISGRIQAQFAALDTDIARHPAPAPTRHFFARRLYLTARADLGPHWNSNLTYDFAGESFDAAWIQYKGSALSVDLGLRKVNLGLEERSSSGSLPAIERSAATRYFAESNNGRRLGAASYRVGVFADGKSPTGRFFYGTALTNPERVSAATSIGSGASNQPALWANAGVSGKLGRGSLVLGAGAGHLPDQGGRSPGSGDDLSVYTVYADLRGLADGRFALAAELLGATVERGAATLRDAKPWGYWVQPSFKLSAPFELVARYSALDSDGRGVSLSDALRSAPSGGTHDKLRELFAGGSWYLRGNDLKLQLGYVYGQSRGAILGGTSAPKARTQGLRSQMQLNF